ncbi:hypothetical protein BX600DRAFT_101416 [Xylariales sp. PMI_506]|nr:hypothetical protein BX600DRAFT_101416 [Xylariales sp. PMI_506]
MSLSSRSIEGQPLQSIGTYGYIWADWLYGHDKGTFMVEVYNSCRDIDGCTDPREKAAKLLLLQKKVEGSKKSWVDGVLDFIELESQLSPGGLPSFDALSNVKDYRTIEIIHAAYMHGAFRGLCKPASGAEWIGLLGGFCAAAVHQGLKWVRISGGVSNWELPTLGEPWCKGTVMWGLVSMHMVVDIAGVDPGNDAALERIHTVIQAHHFAGTSWLKYRGAHPHISWSGELCARAPSESSIRDFGQKHSWPDEMTDILSRGAKHINAWKNPSFNPVYQERMLNLLVWDHTPRLKSRLIHLVDELTKLVDDITESEAAELLSRSASWLSAHTAGWRGRGDRNDKVLELSALGAFLGVLRHSRMRVPNEFTD